MNVRKRPFNPYKLFTKFDADCDGNINSNELLLLLSAMRLDGFTAADFNEACKLFEKDSNG